MTDAPLRSTVIDFGAYGAPRRLAHERVQLALPPLEQMLGEGGDIRLALDPVTGRSRYGCTARPDPGPADFGSATASIISREGFAAAKGLRVRLAEADGREPRAITYARELERQGGELAGLCGLDGVEVVFAASGTDLHLIVADLLSGPAAAPTLCIDIEPCETGSGVPAALGGRHFSGWTALGAPVSEGAPVGPAGTEFAALAARDHAGRLRPAAEVEAELNAMASAATHAGRKVLLTVADVSKTGLVSPRPDAVLALRERFGDRVEVLIDACQFRLAPATLAAYLSQGFMVAVTGSKFLAGPTFSGALLVPPQVAERLSVRLPHPGLRAYSARAEWPPAWVVAAALTDQTNYGLLLRWEAALTELRVFGAMPETAVAASAQAFADAVNARLDADPRFERLETSRLDRSALGVSGGWDEAATIFPFLVRHADGRYLSLAANQDVYRDLMARRVRLGQPVLCGERDGRPISALRLCNSARLLTEAADPQPTIGRALSALDAVIEAADEIGRLGRG